MQSPNIEPPNKSNHPPRPPSPLPRSFSSLPEDIVMGCLSRISRSYYPKLSLVSKNFCSLVLSKEIYKVRRQLKTQEECLYLSLRSPTHPCLIWYSLWINPDRTGNLLLVPVPSSYAQNPTDIMSIRVGSENYVFGEKNSSSSSFSSVVRVFNQLSGKWREDAPSMMVARKEPFSCVLGGKLYVFGGCRTDEATYWAEVFDPKTQTWEPLADPGPELRFSSNIKLVPVPGKIYVKTANKSFVYLVKENKWQVETKHFMENRCIIGNVIYSYTTGQDWWWYDTNSKQWRAITGLVRLWEYSKNDSVLGTYGGKLVIFWDTPSSRFHIKQTKEIWCAVIILLDKRLYRPLEGQIEWVGIVLTVPESYTLVRCVNLDS